MSSTRLLVIDDDPHLGSSLKEFFRYEGFDVESATGFAEGIASHMKHPADIAIVDIYMPERDGIETIVELKKLSPSLKIIAMSGGGNLPKQGDYLVASLKFGANATFAKPVDPAVLLAKVLELAGEPKAPDRGAPADGHGRTAAGPAEPGNFSCPLCRSGSYSTVPVGNTTVSPLLSLYECAGCRFTFTDPLRYGGRAAGPS